MLSLIYFMYNIELIKQDKKKMNKTTGAAFNWINFLLEFIADIPNELINVLECKSIVRAI
jgi:hypothetical protein